MYIAYWPNLIFHLINICDMIKWNGSDVGNIDFELQAQSGDKFVCFTLFWTSKNVHISATRCPIEMRFGSTCSILNGQVIYIEKSQLNIADMFPLIVSHISTFSLIDSYVYWHVSVIMRIDALFQM